MQHDRIHHLREPGSARKAFTLVEMLVAVGAVALVSVGLAAVFQTVGRTVTTGKRISALTQQAAVLESQMREDFKHMTRDGFLVIRNQFTMIRGNNGPSITGTTRFPGDPLPARPRRIDEILFFATGEFRTSREDLVPGRTATSRAARIYYGHGQKATPLTPQQAQNFQTDIHYYNPWFADWFEDSTAARLGETGGQGINRYASTWNLVRHAMLLIRPTSSTDGGWPQDRPRPNYPGDQYAASGTALNNLSSDSTFQIAGQPAANSIFRTMNEMLPMVDQQYGKNAARGFSMFWDKDPSSGGDFNVQGITPRTISGVVDIAATDLDEVAMVVNGSYYSPSDRPTGLSFFGPRKTTGVGVLEPPLPLMNGAWMNGTGQTQPAFYPTSYIVPVTPNTPNALNTTAARMQSWMLNAMPAPSGYHPTIYAQDTKPINNGDGLTGRVGFRIRCEDDLPDVRGTMDRFSNRAVQTKRNDLLAVGLSKIASRCSEFIVEWSFGQTYPAGLPDVLDPETGKTVNFSNRTIWYGRTLNAGSGTPGVYHYQLPGSTDKKAQFPDSQLSQIDLSFKPYKGNPEFAGITKIDDYIVPEWLVHGVYKWRPGGLDQSSLISYFGYFDPTYKPDDVTQPPSLPWAWPRMIRVTLTLADASDPSLEQTFQYVFDLPPDPKP
ncbi:MAG: type II secretion system protein [Phycisphaeraceae bacterium]|nr:type II secretion system protein [Phycisphaeraceae bacterium]